MVLIKYKLTAVAKSLDLGAQIKFVLDVVNLLINLVTKVFFFLSSWRFFFFFSLHLLLWSMTLILRLIYKRFASCKFFKLCKLPSLMHLRSRPHYAGGI